MCDVYIPEVGYICRGCISEFRDYLTERGITNANRSEIKKMLGAFLEIPKYDPEISIEQFFSDYYE